MQSIEFDEILPYSAKDLFDLVMNADKYPDIVDVIKKTETQKVSENVTSVNATIEIPKIGVPVHYSCTLEHVPPLEIKAAATKSPFKQMEGGLVFTPLPNGQTKVSCRLHYKIGLNPVALIASIAMQSQIDKGRAIVRKFLDEHDVLPKVPVQQKISPGVSPNP